MYDANGNVKYDTGEPVIAGAVPANQTLLGAPLPAPFVVNPQRPDPHVLFVDTSGNGRWDAGETVVYDGNLNAKFDGVDLVIAGSVPAPGALLSTDPKLTYVDSHRNNIWDDGYVWDFGDGPTLSTGNVTSHLFQSALSANSAGKFSVKLVVFDSDDGLPNRQIQILTVGLTPVNDIAVFLEISKPVLNVGEPLIISGRISNRGNQPIVLARMNVTYDLNTLTTIGSNSSISLSLGRVQLFNFSLNTAHLTPRTYTVTVRANILNVTSGAVIPNAQPDNVADQSFVLQGTLPISILSLPILVGGAAGLVGVASAVVYLRRRRRTEES